MIKHSPAKAANVPWSSNLVHKLEPSEPYHAISHSNHHQISSVSRPHSQPFSTILGFPIRQSQGIHQERQGLQNTPRVFHCKWWWIWFLYICRISTPKLGKTKTYVILFTSAWHTVICCLLAVIAFQVYRRKARATQSNTAASKSSQYMPVQRSQNPVPLSTINYNDFHLLPVQYHLKRPSLIFLFTETLPCW